MLGKSLVFFKLSYFLMIQILEFGGMMSKFMCIYDICLRKD